MIGAALRLPSTTVTIAGALSVRAPVHGYSLRLASSGRRRSRATHNANARAERSEGSRREEALMYQQRLIRRFVSSATYEAASVGRMQSASFPRAPRGLMVKRLRYRCIADETAEHRRQLR